MTTWPKASAVAWPPAAAPVSWAEEEVALFGSESEADPEMVEFEDVVEAEDDSDSDGYNENDESMIPPPSAGHGKPWSTRSSTSSNGKTSSPSGVGVSPGEQGGRPRICLMPECDKPQKKKSKWCQIHNCHFDNLKYFMEHNKANGSKENRIAWCEEMKDVNKAIAAITQQEQNNAGISKWKNTSWQTSKALKVAEMTSQEESGVSPASPGKQGNSDQRGGLQMCLMPKCEKPQKKTSRWC